MEPMTVMCMKNIPNKAGVLTHTKKEESIEHIPAVCMILLFHFSLI